ncbi:MAG TPA: polysaccharide biosynthesis/export family protein [Terriglobales bacterium]|nr:polysaccharide biosynthesis/export family protein [Terriglobales bacterium]
MAQRSTAEAPAPAHRQLPDIFSYNFDKVAASADQILEVLTKEAGLMVEFKRLMAREAGVSGQIVEESDLTDDAVFERLRSDLRARALATRLLQRYGYLVPQLNPDSDLEAEQKLVRQERAQMLARAAERRDSLGEDSRASRNAACAQQNGAECAQPVLPSGDRESWPMNPAAPGSAPGRTTDSPVPWQRTEGSSPDGTVFPNTFPNMSPDGWENSPDQRQGYPAGSGAPAPGTMLAASESNQNFSPGRSPRTGGYGSGENQSFPGGNRAPDEADLAPLYPPSASSNGGSLSRTGKNSERGAGARDAAANKVQDEQSRDEQGRIVHRPNPYADVPSLYDLYVQARASNRPLERFGLDVFRKDAANPDYIPMDLPVGPSYVVGPGDSLSIDLWGGASQRLLRTVDREGRVALPEAGPVLVSGRTLGDVQEIVQRTLRTQFRDISADVALLRLRSVRMYVVGEVRAPGAYDVSSLSTPLNALFVAGGVTAQGSLRRLQHYRGKQLIEEVDAYDLLLHGIRGDLARVENGDSLLVPALGPTVTIEGMVRRPAVYELRDEKTLLDLVDLISAIAGKRLRKIHDLKQPQGVRGRNSDNNRLRHTLGWEPSITLEDGLATTYRWIENELRHAGRVPANCMARSVG